MMDQELREYISMYARAAKLEEITGPAQATTESGTPYVVYAVGASFKDEGVPIKVYATTPADIAHSFRCGMLALIDDAVFEGKTKLIWRRLPEVTKSDAQLAEWDIHSGLGGHPPKYIYHKLYRATARFAFE